MKIGSRHNICHPATEVFEALRDKQAELVAFLPNVEGVEIVERAEELPKVRIHSRWQGSSDDVAGVIRPFINREMMAWSDRATWDAEQLCCSWELESAKAKGVFECSGTTCIIADGDDASVFQMDGEMHVHAEKLPGVPGFVARRIREPIEKFVANLLNPNLGSMAKAVQDYLDRQKA